MDVGAEADCGSPLRACCGVGEFGGAVELFEWRVFWIRDLILGRCSSIFHSSLLILCERLGSRSDVTDASLYELYLIIIEGLRGYGVRCSRYDGVILILGGTSWRLQFLKELVYRVFPSDWVRLPGVSRPNFPANSVGAQDIRLVRAGLTFRAGDHS